MSSHDKNLIERVDDLESQLAFQEQTITELNQLVAQQNKELSTFKRHLQMLAQRVEQSRDQHSDNPVDEPPPHY
jgi:SlyX protein